MSKNQTTVPELGMGQETKKMKETRKERKYLLETLRGDCVRLFGCTSSTFDGAFFNEDSTKEYTVAEAETVISKWIGKGMKM